MPERERPQPEQAGDPTFIALDPAADILGGANPRGEVAGCPTGMSRPAELPSRPPDNVARDPHQSKPRLEPLEGRDETGRDDPAKW